MPTACMALPVRLHPAFDGSTSQRLLTATRNTHTIQSTSYNVELRAAQALCLCKRQTACCPLTAGMGGRDGARSRRERRSAPHCQPGHAAAPAVAPAACHCACGPGLEAPAGQGAQGGRRRAACRFTPARPWLIMLHMVGPDKTARPSVHTSVELLPGSVQGAQWRSACMQRQSILLLLYFSMLHAALCWSCCTCDALHGAGYAWQTLYAMPISMSCDVGAACSYALLQQGLRL